MTKPLPPRLLEIEDGYYVAGTHDIHVAVQIVSSEHPNFEDYDRGMPADVTAELVAELAERLHGLIATAHRSWDRKVPAMRGNCSCGEHHAWDLVWAKPGSPGAFRVVWWAS
jgi:hypothetical protein